MSLVLFASSFSAIFFLSIASPDTCKVVTMNFSILHQEKRLWGFQFCQLSSIPNFLQCARQCFFRRRCLSFNYNTNKTSCELNNARRFKPYATLRKADQYIYSDIADWDKAIAAGPCANQPCGICEACYPTQSNYTCVKEEITSCRDINICTGATTDGDYLVRPNIGKGPWLKVYCYEMASDYPKDYLTLHKKNYGMYPPIHYKSCTNIDWTKRNPGIIYYYKIRLDLTVLRVLTGDKTFTNISCDPTVFNLDADSFNKSGTVCGVNLAYGRAGDCMATSCNPRRGKLHIDLGSTGLRVPSTLKWISKGYAQKISSFFRSSTGEIITVVCGGNCGWCKPNGHFYLEPIP